MGSVTWKVNELGDVEEIHHRVPVFRVEVEDELHARGLLYHWRDTTQVGKYVFENMIGEFEITKFINPETFQYRFGFTVSMEKKKLSEFYLRFGFIIIKD